MTRQQRHGCVRTSRAFGFFSVFSDGKRAGGAGESSPNEGWWGPAITDRHEAFGFVNQFWTEKPVAWPQLEVFPPTPRRWRREYFPSSRVPRGVFGTRHGYIRMVTGCLSISSISAGHQIELPESVREALSSAPMKAFIRTPEDAGFFTRISAVAP